MVSTLSAWLPTTRKYTKLHKRNFRKYTQNGRLYETVWSAKTIAKLKVWHWHRPAIGAWAVGGARSIADSVVPPRLYGYKTSLARGIR